MVDIVGGGSSTASTATTVPKFDKWGLSRTKVGSEQFQYQPVLTYPSSLVPRPEKRAWYTLSAHAPKCTENPGTSYISVKQSVNYGT